MVGIKRKLNLGKKTCVNCGNSFQPASGVQKTCSPTCRNQAKAKGLTGQGRWKEVEEPNGVEKPLDAVVEALVASSDPPPADAQPVRSVRRQPRRQANAETAEAEPSLELDLSPLENYIQYMVNRAVRTLVNEAIDERLRRLFTGQDHHK